MNRVYELAVFIARLQPLHYGHLSVLTEALKVADRVLILVGSSDCAPNTRNPFTFEEREKMIHVVVESFMGSEANRVIIEPLNDYPYAESMWDTQVIDLVEKHSRPDDKVTLIGYEKDNSSYYLKKFPRWHSHSVKPITCGSAGIISSTTVRDAFFLEGKHRFPGVLPNAISGFLLKYKATQEKTYETIKQTILYEKNYLKDWPNDPHVTVDSVCIQANHVLLVERGEYPGKGLLALPGGFVNQREFLADAAIRELKEETSIDIPKGVLRDKIVANNYFDHPYRSNRARVITSAFLFDLNSEIDRKIASGVESPIPLTKVKGGDDAAKAMWVDISNLKKRLMFEDHYDIVLKMLTYL